MRAAIYARVSTEGQSTERQVAELRLYAESRGWEVVHVAEETASGANPRRRKREDVLRLAKTRQIDVVLCQALDRWGRSVADLVLTMAELEAQGVVFCVPGQVDMSTPMGRMLAHFLGAVGEFERHLIRERVMSGLQNAKAKGKRLGRPAAAAGRVEEGLERLRGGATYAEVSAATGVSESTLRRKRRAKMSYMDV